MTLYCDVLVEAFGGLPMPGADDFNSNAAIVSRILFLLSTA
jgi:hypothetical protein